MEEPKLTAEAVKEIIAANSGDYSLIAIVVCVCTVITCFILVLTFYLKLKKDNEAEMEKMINAKLKGCSTEHSTATASQCGALENSINSLKQSSESSIEHLAKDMDSVTAKNAIIDEYLNDPKDGLYHRVTVLETTIGNCNACQN